LPPTWRFEDEAYGSGRRFVAGIDEVGRGSLAGPVFAAAVILDRNGPVDGVDDSKLLTPARRVVLAREVLAQAVAVGIGSAGADEVDRINIRNATLRAMRRAVEALPERADHLLLDAATLDGVDATQVSLIKGDRRSFSIAAASIVAKVLRDGVMEHYAASYPVFGFESNRGYGTAGHLQALARFGPCPIHRRSFRGVRAEGSLAFES
jgi:ribonuclease HII